MAKPTRPDNERIVITGVGVVAPNGIGKEEFWTNCFAGVSGIRRITLFDTEKYRCHYAGEVPNFEPEKHLGSKGLRNLDRTTLLSLVAAKLALEDSRFEVTDANRDEIGVVLGSTMGSVHSISEFDKEGLLEGPRFVNPACFPNTVINSPASRVAIHFGLRGLNSTISTGFTASLDAVGYAVDMLRLGRVSRLLTGGVEELCIQTFLGFYKLRFLSRTNDGTAPLLAPFDARRRGTLLGEGAAFLMLETLADAHQRRANVYAEILGYGTQFDRRSMYRYDESGNGPMQAIEQALNEAEVSAQEIDCVSACANGTRGCDVMEATALKGVFGSRVRTLAISPIKSMLGESFSAVGALQLAAAVGSLDRNATPVTPTFEESDPVCDIDCRIQSRNVRHVTRIVVDGFGPAGVSSALIIGKPT